SRTPPGTHSFPTRRSSDLVGEQGQCQGSSEQAVHARLLGGKRRREGENNQRPEHISLSRTVQQKAGRRACSAWSVLDKLICSGRSEEHTSELQSRGHLVCR